MEHRYAALLTALLLGVLQTAAQITGRIVDQESQQALVSATLQLYKINKADTTFTAGGISDAQGRFTFSNTREGNYLLKISYLGYKEVLRSLTKVRGRNLTLGNIVMEPNAVVLDEAVVTGNVPKMVIKDDTVVYNADAFRVPEGTSSRPWWRCCPAQRLTTTEKLWKCHKNTPKKFLLIGLPKNFQNQKCRLMPMPCFHRRLWIWHNGCCPKNFR